MRLEDMLTDEELEEWKATRATCRKYRSGSKIGSSALASCKSQGLLPRTGKKKITIGKRRVKVAGKKIRGVDYGGPFDDYKD